MPTPPKGRPFGKGKSGNPGGRPKGFAARVRERVSVDDMIDYAESVMATGEHKDGIAAMKFLAERGWGKPEQVIGMEHSGAVDYSMDVSKLSKKEREALKILLGKG